MEIVKAHINSFGKLKNLDVDFSKGINTVFQKNGYGKTTFTVFLKAMFYGMAKKGNNKAYAAERSKYAPWQGGIYGGSLTFKLGNKLYTIIREFASAPEGDSFQLIDEQTGLVSKDFTKDIGNEIFGVGVETFEITAFFAQDGLMGNVNDEVRANLTGANKFENDLADCSLAQKKIASAITLAKSSCPKLAEIDGLKQSIKEVESLQTSLSKEIEKHQIALKQVTDSFDKLESTQEEIKKKHQKAIADKEKATVIASQIENCKANKDKLLQEKLSLLNNASAKSEEKKPVKNKTFLLFVILSSCAIVFGLGFIIASFFTSLKAVFLTIGIVAVVVALLLFGIAIIKKVGTAEQTHIMQKEELANELKLTELDKNLIELDKEISLYEKQFDELNENTEDVDYDEKVAEIYELDKNKSVLNLKISQLKENLQAGEERLSYLKESLESLIEKRENQTKRLYLLEKTKEFLAQAKENVSKRYLEPMQQSFKEIFSNFDNQENLMLDINLNVNQMTDVGLKEIDYLSQGYQDLVEICKRFALLNQVFLKEKPFIILDDPFVNLDDDKLQMAKQLVSKFAENYQIIYICSHSRCKL